MFSNCTPRVSINSTFNLLNQIAHDGWGWLSDMITRLQVEGLSPSTDSFFKKKDLAAQWSTTILSTKNRRGRGFQTRNWSPSYVE